MPGGSDNKNEPGQPRVLTEAERTREAQIKNITKKMESLFLRVQQTRDMIPALGDTKSKSAFQIKCNRLTETRKEYSETLDRLNTLKLEVNPSASVSYQPLNSFDDLLDEILAVKAELDVSEQTVKVNSTAGSVPKLPEISPALPKIDLKQFNGDLTMWIPYFNLFHSLVDSNSSLTSVQKMLYLLSTLKGEPHSLIKHLPVIDSNYEVALMLLKSRYHSIRQLASIHADKIINIKPIQTESYAKIRSLYETILENYSALQALQIPDLADYLLFHVTFKNLDSNTRRCFESQLITPLSSSVSQPVPTFQQLMDFLGRHCKILEASDFTPSTSKELNSRPESVGHRNYRPSFTNIKKAYVLTSRMRSQDKTKPPIMNDIPHKHFSNSVPSPHKCGVCSGSHSIYLCSTLKSLTPSERTARVVSLKRCVQCLGAHKRSDCKSTNSCYICSSKSHHSLLHQDSKSDLTFENRSSPELSSNSLNVYSSLSSSNICDSVLLGTALVHVKTGAGKFITARMLIDSGAQASFISKSLFSLLDLPYRKINVSVSGLGQTVVTQPRGVSVISIKPRHTDQPLLTTEVVILDKLAGKLPSSSLQEHVKLQFRNLNLADPYFNESSEIQGIIGAELFPLIYDGRSSTISPGQPTALSSIFGWVVTGPVSSSLRLSSFSAEVSLNNTLKSFWEVEQAPGVKFTDPEDDICEHIFVSSYTRDTDGRYYVPLLLRNSHTELGGSFGKALRCLHSTERKLNNNGPLRDEYHSFMTEYVKLGHMKKLTETDAAKCYVIPHHAVLNPLSLSTKLRVVFNGSSLSDSGLSLNDVLYTGAKLQGNIVEIISKFRTHAVAFSADISKMFRQIRILPDQTHLQRILWRFNANHPVSVYELLTVTYGLRSSPYLACRTLKQLSIDEGANFPRASEIILHETYVDDIISGAPSLKEAVKVQEELTRFLSRGGFQLRKWSSSHTSFLENIPPEDRLSDLVIKSDDATLKLLGVQWSPQGDYFTYKYVPVTPKFTKRNILSDISKLYDPLGWVSPVVFLAKTLIQRLWLIGVNWDDPVPVSICNLWSDIMGQLPSLSNIKIPRLVIPSAATEHRLIGFCDASEKGYAAVVYLHSYIQNNSQSHLLLGKSRVAPLKTISIPRLELCAAVLLSQLFNVLIPIYSQYITLKDIYAFSDSMIVLSWLRTSPHLLKTFVANRVSEITDILPPSSWHHIRTNDNPADCASRGMLPHEFIKFNLWFCGPSWLTSPVSYWPLSSEIGLPSALPELRCHQEVLLAQKSLSLDDYVGRFSSLLKLQRITAWVLKAFKKMRGVNITPLDRLTTEDLNHSLTILVKAVQQDYFSTELHFLKNSQECPARFRSLCPFIDSLGLLRVGGRLKYSNLSFEARHPLLLPKSGHFTTLLIDHYHKVNLHVGPRTLHSLIQRKFWILSARQVIRSRLSKCLPCLKMRNNHLQPLMGDLPLDRVQASRPFSIVGTDFGGPFHIKQNKLRNARITKAYLCLFICFSTKAVHLEVVSDLTTEGFIAALDRFISRRGLCNTIYSDCGTNFIGANRYLTELHQFIQGNPQQNHINNYFVNKDIKWKFSVPSAPHFGGIYEAGIKSSKHLLRKVVPDKALTFEELSTLFCRVEAVLNSRPLCALSSDPHEYDTLTPGHFLVGAPLSTRVEEDLKDIPVNRLSRWELVRMAAQSFWRRWHREYLHTLMQRSKWSKGQANLKLNDLVLLNDGIRSPPQCWRIGRITALHPGPDKIVRVVTVRTADGEFRRPVVKLALLPEI